MPRAYIEYAQRPDSPVQETFSVDSDGNLVTQLRTGAQMVWPRQLYDAESAIAEMDRRGLDMAVVSVSPNLFKYELEAKATAYIARMLNEAIGELVAKYSRRFRGLATVPLQDGHLAAKVLEASATEAGMVGVEIATHVKDTNLDAASLEPFFAAAAALKRFIFVHPASVLAPHRLSKYYLTNLLGNPTETAIAIASIIFSGLMDRHPELKICFAHGGGTLPYQIGRLDHGFRVREECRHLTDTPYNYMRRLYFDTLTHDTRALQYLLDCVGPDHVLLGTDHPFDMGQPDAIAELSAAFADTPDIVPEAILGGNAVRLLNLPVNGHDALD